jgi:hypothetical protein
MLKLKNCHKAIWGKESTSAHILNLDTRWRIANSFLAPNQFTPALVPTGEEAGQSLEPVCCELY